MFRWKSMVSFLRCERGAAAGAEFVMTLPLTLGVLVLATEYGEGLITREIFDSALRDATRVLSRAPMDVNVSGEPVFYPHFLNVAEEIIAARTGRSLANDEVQFSARLFVVDDSANPTRTGVILIETEARIIADLGLLSWLQQYVGTPIQDIRQGLGMSAIDRARWVGENAPGTIPCSQARRTALLCGGPT